MVGTTERKNTWCVHIVHIVYQYQLQIKALLKQCKKLAKLSMQPQWEQMLYQVALLFKIMVSWKFYARINEIAKISVILEHRDLSANSESLNANSKSLNANSSSFDANLENLNDSERLNANSKYSRQHN